ncbi:MAG: transglutaminase domain-containing protein [Proteobacteria bacterium]|nr:transglutaminase domain-containing protein [Pseudomonadota bacterium]
MLIKKILILTFVFSILIFGGWKLIKFEKNTDAKFEGILVFKPVDYQSLISPDSPDLKPVIKKIRSLPEAYYFVRDFIGFFPMVSDTSIKTTLSNKYSSCMGKAILLASLYRALGIGKDDLRIMVGQIKMGNEIIDHSWVEVKINNVWYQQDTTDLLGKFEFDQFPDRTYSKIFCSRENFCFNETGFAVVSQLNLLR